MKDCWSNFYSHVSHHFADSYNERLQTPQYPQYYSEQQDHCRESSYWTLPGSRAVASMPTYANWTDQNLAGHSSSHFPFILNTQPQHQHHMRHYQLHEGRDREWTSVKRASVEHDREFLKEGWQRRWETGSPVRYNNREAPSKRNDESYRELEAWAIRYSHSVPRRRRIEAEMRGTTPGFVDSSGAMDNPRGTDPRLVALQQVLHSNSNVKAAELWTEAGRQQSSIHHPSQNHLNDQRNSPRKAFSQPPGYVAPPPYNSPQKSLQMLQRDIRQKDLGQQNLRSHNTDRGQNSSESYRNEQKDNQKKSDDNLHDFLKSEGPHQLKMETETLQESPAVSVQESNIHCGGMLSLQPPQLLYSTSIQPNNLSPKVIEGRKFRLNKKKGGLTIFCLVSRIADTSEDLGLSAYPQKLKSTIKDNATLQSGDLSETAKLADEVDFMVPPLGEQSNASPGINDLNQQGAVGECMQGHLPGNYSSNKTDNYVVSKEEEENNAKCTIERQVTHLEQSSSVKYPLWKEPSFLCRSETEILSTCPTEGEKEEKTDISNYEAVSTEAATKNKVETAEIKEVSDFEHCKCVPVVDTSCVVVKIEIISSPKKENVHYLDSTAEPEHSLLNIQMAHSAENGQPSIQLNQDITQENLFEKEAAHLTELPQSEVILDSKQKQTMEDETLMKISIDSISSVSEKESLEGRAHQILGIPVDDCFKEQQVQLDNVQTHDAVCLVENGENLIKAEDASAEDLAKPQEQLSLMHEQNNDLQCDLSIHLLPETSDGPSCGTTRSTPSLESNVTTEELSQSLILSNVSSSLLLLSPNAESLGCDVSPLKFSLDKRLDPGLMSLNQPPEHTPNQSPPSETTSPQLALTPPHTEAGQTSNLQDLSTLAHTNNSPEDSCPIQCHLDLINEIAETSSLKDQEEKGQSVLLRSCEIGDAHFHFVKDETDKVVSKQHFEKFGTGCCMEDIFVATEERAKKSNDSQVDQMTDRTLEMSQRDTSEINKCLKEQQCFYGKEGSLNDKQDFKDDSAEQGKTSPTEIQVLPQLQMFPQSSDNHASISKDLEKTKSAAGTVEKPSSQEENASEVNTLHEKHINPPQKMTCAEQTCIPEDHPKDGASKDYSPQLKEPIPKQTATDSQSHEKTENWQNNNLKPISILTPTLTLDSDTPSCEFFSSDMDTKATLKENVDGACPAIITQSVYCQDYIVTKETLRLSPSRSSDLSPSILPLVEGESDPTNCLQEEEPQYPQSLWDAVSRIRKHTAPDSENEEEEVNELWDPESAGEDATGSMSAQDLNLNWSSVLGEREGWTLLQVAGSEEFGYLQIQKQAEDTLSCSSTSSHGSEDTVVIATDEEEVVDALAHCASTSTAHEDTKQEQCCLSEVADENATVRVRKCTC